MVPREYNTNLLLSTQRSFPAHLQWKTCISVGCCWCWQSRVIWCRFWINLCGGRSFSCKSRSPPFWCSSGDPMRKGSGRILSVQWRSCCWGQYPGDGNVAGEIELERHWNEFVERHQVVWWDQWNVQNEHKNVFLRPIGVGSFNEEEVGGFIGERKEFTFSGHLIDVVNNFEECFMMQGPSWL